VRLLSAAIVVACLLFTPRAEVSVGAWGVVGHRVVARLAWAQMTPAARTHAATVLGESPGTGHDAFVSAATWADEVRPARPETYNWHFVDIPVGKAPYDAARDCPSTERGDCVIAAIARARVELVDANRPAALKAESLKFLIHFVGDLHQPLHTIDNHDRGGNDVIVAALRGDEGRPTNLHAAWDTGLINLSPETESARAERLLADLRRRRVAIGLDVVTWVEESHAIGRRVVYNYPSFSLTGPGPDAIALNDAYRKTAVAEIDRRLQLAGARLGALLNSLLVKTSEVVSSAAPRGGPRGARPTRRGFSASLS
jgi:hypothetical protein